MELCGSVNKGTLRLTIGFGKSLARCLTSEQHPGSHAISNATGIQFCDPCRLLKVIVKRAHVLLVHVSPCNECYSICLCSVLTDCTCVCK